VREQIKTIEVSEDMFREYQHIIRKQLKELTALRSWKHKARPFLEEAVRNINEYYHPAITSDLDDIWEEEKRDLETLTELLKEAE